MPFFSDPPLSRGPHPGQSETSTCALRTPLGPGWGWPAFLWRASDPEATLLPARLSVVLTPGFGAQQQKGLAEARTTSQQLPAALWRCRVHPQLSLSRVSSKTEARPSPAHEGSGPGRQNHQGPAQEAASCPGPCSLGRSPCPRQAYLLTGDRSHKCRPGDAFASHGEGSALALSASLLSSGPGPWLLPSGLGSEAPMAGGGEKGLWGLRRPLGGGEWRELSQAGGSWVGGFKSHGPFRRLWGLWGSREPLMEAETPGCPGWGHAENLPN
ncbi:uncharacterized protein LOC123790578 isoform X2 [Ursus americanus]|nr:uncharacterized protein LOC123790578 isoform X2 [Ursus americanus]